MKRFLEEENDFSDVTLEDIEYIPVRFNQTINGTEESAIFPEIDTVLSSHESKLYLTVKDGDKETVVNSTDLKMLREKKVFHKNSEACKRGNGLRTN